MKNCATFRTAREHCWSRGSFTCSARNEFVTSLCRNLFTVLLVVAAADAPLFSIVFRFVLLYFFSHFSFLIFFPAYLLFFFCFSFSFNFLFFASCFRFVTFPCFSVSCYSDSLSCQVVALWNSGLPDFGTRRCAPADCACLSACACVSVQRLQGRGMCLNRKVYVGGRKSGGNTTKRGRKKRELA